MEWAGTVASRVSKSLASKPGGCLEERFLDLDSVEQMPALEHRLPGPLLSGWGVASPCPGMRQGGRYHCVSREARLSSHGGPPLPDVGLGRPTSSSARWGSRTYLRAPIRAMRPGRGKPGTWSGGSQPLQSMSLGPLPAQRASRLTPVTAE